MGRIVVGVDDSPNAADALRWASSEGRARDWTLEAVLCWGYLDQHYATEAEFDPAYTADDARRAVDAIVVAALGDAAASVERALVNDLAPRGLLERSRGADLLVLGARGVGAVAELTLGSVSYQCLHHSTVPVVIVRGAGAATGRIVVGVDGSDDSERALRWATEAASARDAHIDAVLAWTPPSKLGLLMIGGPTDPHAYEGAAREILDRVVDAVEKDEIGPPIERTVVRGDARTLLVERGEGADLIVVGSRGLGGFAGLLVGSVGHYLAHHAPCPTVFIPHRRDDRP